MTSARSVGLAVLVSALLLAEPLRAADEDAIAFAVQKGVHFLKTQQARDGKWNHTEIGATALAALALLESGVEPDDPSILAAARAIREQCPRLTKTYSIALSILFLDRLGVNEDVPLIESLTVRLLGGQTHLGNWSYNCPPIPETESRRLSAVLIKGNEAKPPANPQPKDQRTVRDLPDEIQKQLDLIDRGGGPAVAQPISVAGVGDNSNTQFAILGLWVGRRHGLPVGKALARADMYFRTTQSPTGGWAYTGSAAAEPTPAMTCAGLLGLALGYGVAKEAMDKKDPGGKIPPPVDLNKDMAIKRGLIALGTAIGQPRGNALAPGVKLPVIDEGNNGRGFYFLFSLERVAVAYNLKTISNKDWYSWGAEILIANQAVNGSWHGEYGGSGADTAFALLFLRKANLVSDLSATLRGMIKDPDERELREGGVGGAAFLKKVGLKPAFDNSTNPTRKPDDAPPKRRLEGEAAKLSDEVLKAPAGKQERLLEQLRDSKGADYTDALADVVSRLEGEMKAKARDALADRLTRMTSTTLKDKLDDSDPEIRRAAALAVAMKDDKSHLGRLVQLLEDEETFVARAAHAALKSFNNNKDLGSPAAPSKEERARAIANWKEWLAKQNR